MISKLLLLPFVLSTLFGSEPAFKASELTNFEAFQQTRTRHNLVWLDPKTGTLLQRRPHNAPEAGPLVPAAKDDDVARDLSNLVSLVTIAPAGIVGPAVGTVLPSLQAIFSNQDDNRLYQLGENVRRANSEFLTDAIGGPIYKVDNRGQHEKVVKMYDITDKATLADAICRLFPAAHRPAAQRPQ